MTISEVIDFKKMRVEMFIFKRLITYPIYRGRFNINLVEKIV